MANVRPRGRFKRILNKENLRKPIFWGGFLGIVFILVVVVGLVYYVVDLPKFCISCHIEKGPYETWQKSTHSRVGCTACHVDPGFVNAIKFRGSLFQLIYVTITKRPTRPRDVGLPSNESCDLCHKAKRTVSPSGDLKIPHASHIKLRGLKCVDCHKALVHTVRTANKEPRNRPPMIACYKCHDGKKAPNTCEACHTEKAIPDDHTADDWLRMHSQKQKNDPEYCVSCHGWVKDYCSECHQRRPRSHATKWRTNHQARISGFGKGGCMHCHKDAMCIRCHGQVP